jgi:hypothetical protein
MTRALLHTCPQVLWQDEAGNWVEDRWLDATTFLSYAQLKPLLTEEFISTGHQGPSYQMVLKLQEVKGSAGQGREGGLAVGLCLGCVGVEAGQEVSGSRTSDQGHLSRREPFRPWWNPATAPSWRMLMLLVQQQLRLLPRAHLALLLLLPPAAGSLARCHRTTGTRCRKQSGRALRGR